MSGLGRAMPITFLAFFVAALSIIGLPPLGGSWPKFLLIMGAINTEHYIMIAVLMLSSLLNVAYLMPIVGKAFFGSNSDIALKKYNEAPILCWLPPVITAVGCIILFFYAGILQDFLTPIIQK
jgi:multicomponent Na+:H+ antiporter subunit D